MSIRRQNLEPSRAEVYSPHQCTTREPERERERATEMGKTWRYGQRGRNGQERLEDINGEKEGHIKEREAFSAGEPQTLPYRHDVLVLK